MNDDKLCVLAPDGIVEALDNLRAALEQAGIETPVALALSGSEAAQTFGLIIGFGSAGICEVRGPLFQLGSLAGVDICFKQGQEAQAAHD